MKYLLNYFNFMLALGLGWLVVVVQSTWLHEIFNIYKPNLLMVMLSYFALNRFMIEGGFLALLLGYFVEVNSGAPLGLYMVVYVMTYYAAKFLGMGFYIKSPLAEIVFVAGVSLFYKVIFLLVMGIFVDVRSILGAAWMTGVSMVILNCLLTPLGFHFLRWIDEVTDKERPSKTGTQERAIQVW